MMNSFTCRQLVFLTWLFLLLILGCSGPQTNREYSPYIAKVFDNEYDLVWDELEKVITDDLRLPIKMKDKKRGIIQTEWVSIIRIKGTLRWNIRTILDRTGNKTVVKIYSQVEEPVSATPSLKKKKEDFKTGWQKSSVQIDEPDELLKRLSIRLGE